MVDATSFSVSYGELEAALGTLCDVDPAVVRVRFRPLRLHDFPDAVQGGAGSRVRYDLPRMLAYAAVFALADGRLPQLAAMELVRATWPEWSRAFLAAAVEADLVARPEGMPAGLRPVLRLMPDGWTRGTGMPVAVVGDDATPSGPPVACRVEIDCRALLLALSAAAHERTGFPEALVALEASFGWRPAVVPFRESVRMMPPARGFLDDGPYFERALALLDACDGRPLTPVSRWRLGRIAAYLDTPAPIDAWKREVGESGGTPRLHHLLAFRARDLGIEPTRMHPDTMRACAETDVAVAARRMIAEAQAQRGVSLIG